MALDDAVAHAQAQPQAGAHVARGEKGLQHAAQVLGGNAGAVVAHPQPQPVALVFAAQRNAGLLARRAGQSQRGIAQQVDQHANDGRLVARHMRVLRQRQVNLDALELKAGQAQRRLDGLFEQEHALAVDARLLVGKGFEVGDDVLHPLQAFARVVQAFLESGALAGGRVHQRHVQRHHAVVDRVVDLMQQAGRQRSERGHFFALDQLALDLGQGGIGFLQGIVLRGHLLL